MSEHDPLLRAIAELAAAAGKFSAAQSARARHPRQKKVSADAVAAFVSEFTYDNGPHGAVKAAARRFGVSVRTISRRKQDANRG
jgi:hypothetical protein